MSTEPLQPIADVTSSILALLAEQYKQPRNDGNTPRVAGIIALVAAEIQLLETAWQELLPLLDIDIASGAQLDVLARIANIARNGASDAVLRTRLKTVFQSRYSGTPEQLMAAVKQYTGSEKVAFIPEYPASFWITYDGEGMTQEYLQGLAPAGVLGLPGCFLADADDELILDANGEGILVVGPCETDPYPIDRTWDGGANGDVGGPLAVSWPFQDGTGIGQYPSGGVGAVTQSDYTFKDGTFADNG